MAEKLKDLFFRKAFIEHLASEIQQIYPGFEQKKFVKSVLNAAWKSRELKDKMRHISSCLHTYLPDSYPQALKILLKVSTAFKGFDSMVFPDFVQAYGIEHQDISLTALAHFTSLGSSEFAIRPFLARDTKGVIKIMKRWAEDENEHLRRLASEGCRPRLPWAPLLPVFIDDPTAVISVLEKLNNDPSEYVRRSVANNLNDISKDHADLVLSICERWKEISPATTRLTKHACRDLLKSGNSRAMKLFGFDSPVNVEIRKLTINSRKIIIGDQTHFSFELVIKGKKTFRTRLEYAVYYRKSRGKISPKIFQIKEHLYTPGNHQITRKITFADHSTRKHYPGEQELAVIVNGLEKARINFSLTHPDESPG